MNLRTQIKNKVDQITQSNAAQLNNYKRNLLNQLENNLQKKKETVSANEGLILRYQGARARGLTQMQQALVDAQ